MSSPGVSTGSAPRTTIATINTNILHLILLTEGNVCERSDKPMICSVWMELKCASWIRSSSWIWRVQVSSLPFLPSWLPSVQPSQLSWPPFLRNRSSVWMNRHHRCQVLLLVAWTRLFEEIEKRWKKVKFVNSKQVCIYHELLSPSYYERIMVTVPYELMHRWRCPISFVLLYTGFVAFKG